MSRQANEVFTEAKRDRRRWLLYGAAFVVATAIAFAVLQWWLPLQAKEELEQGARELGIQIEVSPVRMGLTAARVSEVEGTAPGSRFTVEDAAVTWDLPNVLFGELETVTLQGVEATVDVERFWPVPMPSGRVERQDGRASMSVGAEMPETLADRPREARGHPVPAGDAAPVEVVEPWWETLPMEELLIPSAKLTARYGPAEWPFEIRLAYTAENLKREAWLELESEGIDLQISARELAPNLNWTAQGEVRWEDPLDSLAAFFPEHHPAHPKVLRKWGLDSLSLAEFHVEGVVRGESRRWEEVGLLFEGGSMELAWANDGAAELSEWVVALRGSPGQLELNAGLAVDSWRGGSWAADDFQLTLGWDAEGTIRLETPRLAWTHDSGISGEMTARAFSRWPPAAPGISSAEVQMAFSRVSTPFFSLRPFRFFFNLRADGFDGRLSSLEMTGVEDWAIVNSQLEGHWPTLGDSREISIEATLEYRPKARPMARIIGSVRSQSGGDRLETAGTVRLPEGAVLATWRGLSGEGIPDSLRIAETWDLSEILRWLAIFRPLLAEWTGDGALAWRIDLEGDDWQSFAASLHVSLKGISLSGPGLAWAAHGISGELRAEARPFPRSQGPQALHIEWLRVGPVRLSDVRFRFSWPLWNRMGVETVSGRWLGGEISLDAFDVNPRAPAFSTVARFRNLDPVAARKVFEWIPRSVTGGINGSCPLSYRNGQWFAGTLSLRAGEADDAGWSGQIDPGRQGHASIIELFRAVMAGE